MKPVLRSPVHWVTCPCIRTCFGNMELGAAGGFPAGKMELGAAGGFPAGLEPKRFNFLHHECAACKMHMDMERCKCELTAGVWGIVVFM